MGKEEEAKQLKNTVQIKIEKKKGKEEDAKQLKNTVQIKK